MGRWYSRLVNVGRTVCSDEAGGGAAAREELATSAANTH